MIIAMMVKLAVMFGVTALTLYVLLELGMAFAEWWDG